MAIVDLRNQNYDPIEWEDRVVDQATGQVLVEGTPVNEVNLNRIEAALLLAHLDIGLLSGELVSLLQDISSEIDKYKRQRFVQGQATLTSSGGSYFVASEPFVSISLPTDALPQINAPNYDVLINVISASDWGRIGELIVYDKASNGFKVKMTGSASSVTFMWTIINPAIR